MVWRSAVTGRTYMEDAICSQCVFTAAAEMTVVFFFFFFFFFFFQ